MFDRRLPVLHGREKLLLRNRREVDAVKSVEPAPPLAVEFVENVEHDLAAEVRGLAALPRELLGFRPVEELQIVVDARKSARRPDHLDEPAAEQRTEFNPDADVDIHDPRRPQQLFGRLARNVVVVDDLQLDDALDPRIHDKVGRRLAPLRIRVVHMLVKGERRPVLRHFDQMVPAQQPADEQRIAEHRRAHVVREAQSPQRIDPLADQVLDDLQKRAGRVVAQQHVEPLDDLVAERLQRGETLLHGRNAGLEGVEQPQHGPGHPDRARLRKLPDAARMQILREFGRATAARAITGHGLIHGAHQLVVGGVKQQFRFPELHTPPATRIFR